MKQFTRVVGRIVFILLLVLLLCFGLFRLSKSRNFQLFGGMINNIQTDKKIVALTFDDGPTANTTKMLEILSGHNIKATFFLIGEMIESDTGNFTQHIIQQGHQIGNHSYSHTRMIGESLSFIKREIDTTDDAIRSAGYTGEIHFRTPYGKRLFFTTYWLWKKKQANIFWDIEPETYVSGSGNIAQYIKDHLRPGAIILLHPMYGEDNESLQALAEIITYVTSQGYQFVTIDELLQTTNTTPQFWFK